MQDFNTDEHITHDHASEIQLHGAFTALSYFVVVSLIVAAAIGSQLSFGTTDQTGSLVHAMPQTEEESQPSLFDSIEVDAKAVLVYDVANDAILYERNGDKRMPLASLTKIMTALVAIEHLGPDGEATISQKALETEGDNGFIVADRVTIASLAALTLVSSSNDGAEILAEVTDRESFIKRMNSRAIELQLNDTSFFNPSGLDLSERVSGGYGSAQDVAHLMNAAVASSPAIFAYTTKPLFKTSSNFLYEYRVENTNTHLNEIPGLIASKTGFTDLAGGNLAVMFDAGLARPIIVVVLGSTLEGRFTDVEKLAQATRTELASRY
ncbi:MAG: serine hydrolase [bacterium]|nr:serine hydrolase [bacterium]